MLLHRAAAHWWLTFPLLTALGCALSSLFPSLHLLGWVALVPFYVGLQRCRGYRQSAWFGFITGLLTFGLSTYWMAEFITLFKNYRLVSAVAMASVYWCYCALIFVVVAIVTHRARQTRCELWLFPLALALVFAWFPVLFPWQLGNGQHPFLVAIQGVDITGVSGLDFIIGLVNVLLAQGFMRKRIRAGWQRRLAYGLLLGWFGYGAVQLHFWQKPQAANAVLAVGLVQANGPPSLNPPIAPKGYSLSYPPEMALTEQLAQQGAALVVWPEYDRQYYNLPAVKLAYQRQVAALATPMMLQSVEKTPGPDGYQKFSTITLLDAQGQETGKYQKVQRIAVAEYLPGLDQLPGVKAVVLNYLGDFFGDYQPGPGPARFQLGPLALTPLICYEVILPRFVARSVAASGGNIITVQSNNSWFGDSRVPYQHMGASVLRSVENRRPLIHAMNNGLGGVVAASGQILLQTSAKEIAGYLVEVPYSANPPTTIYQRWPWLTLGGFSIVSIVLLFRRRSVAISV